jgi:hypothetical protein
MERYLQLGWGEHIVFKDTLQFLNASLERLVVSLLKVGADRFSRLKTILQSQYLALGVEHIGLMLRKGVFPYDHLDSFERLNEQDLPSKEQFFSRLRDEDCTEADYNHSQTVKNNL